MTVSTTLDGDRMQALAAQFGGTLLLPSDDGYDAARRVHNGLIDRRPALIAQCSGTADVAAAVRFGRESGLEIAVRGGGHNVAGRCVCDDGLVVDLSPMKGIHVDAQAGTVRAQGGVTWAELNREAAVSGLAVTGGAISSTGIAGYTLGGGLGWLMSTQGLAADNLTGVQLVTAGGDVLDVTDASHPDLMWALRGGGGNFGVAASFEFRVRPQPMVVGGLIAHPVEAGADMLRFYRDAARELPRRADGVRRARARPGRLGHQDRRDDRLPYRSGEGGSRPGAVPRVRLADRGPGRADALPGDEHAARRRISEGRAQLLALELHDRHAGRAHRHRRAAVRVGALTDDGHHLRALPRRRHPRSSRPPPPSPTARRASTCSSRREWIDPADTEKNIAWAKDSYAAVSEHLVERRWLNYLNDDDAGDAIRAAYGPNYDRLVEVKRRYDPENVFRLNHNIAP